MPPTSENSTTRRARAAGLALLACSAAMAAGIASFHWFGFDHAALGLGGMKECFGESCRTLMWSELARVPGDYALFGYLSVLALAGAIALALHAAIALLAGAPRVRTTALEVALGLAGFATVAFWLRVAAGFGADLAYGYAGFLAIAGVAAAAGVVHVLGASARRRPPHPVST